MGCSSRALNGYLAGVDEGKAALRSEGKEDVAVPGLVARPAPSWDSNVFFFFFFFPNHQRRPLCPIALK